VVGLVGAGVPDETSLGISGGGILTDLSAGDSVAVTSLATLFLSRTRSRVVGRGGLVTGLVNRGAALARSGVMEHTIGANEGLLPGFSAEEAVFDQEHHRLGDDRVEELEGDLDGLLRVSVTEEQRLVADGVFADGGQRRFAY